MSELADQWREAIAGWTPRYHLPHVGSIELEVREELHGIRVQFTMRDLQDSRDSSMMPELEFYLLASDYPGWIHARLWVAALWNLLVEHERLEMSGMEPHTSAECAGHREAIDRRHDMQYMIDNWGVR